MRWTSLKSGYKEKDKIDWSLQPVYEKANNFKDNVAAVNNGDVFYFIKIWRDFLSVKVYEVKNITIMNHSYMQ